MADVAYRVAPAWSRYVESREEMQRTGLRRIHKYRERFPELTYKLGILSTFKFFHLRIVAFSHHGTKKHFSIHFEER